MGFLSKLFGGKDVVFGAPPEGQPDFGGPPPANSAPPGVPAAPPQPAPLIPPPPPPAGQAPPAPPAGAPAAVFPHVDFAQHGIDHVELTRGAAGPADLRVRIGAALAQRGVKVSDSQLDQLVARLAAYANAAPSPLQSAATLEAAVGAQGPRLRLALRVPPGLGAEQITALEMEVARHVVVDPGVVAAAQAGDHEGAQRAAAAVAAAVTGQWIAQHPAAPAPDGTSVSFRQAILDLGFDRIGKPLDATRSGSGAPQVVVRVESHSRESVPALVQSVAAAVRADAEVLRLVAAGDLTAAQQRAQQVVDGLAVMQSPPPVAQAGIVVRQRTVLQLPILFPDVPPAAAPAP